MLTSKIVDTVNKNLSGEMYTIEDISDYIDEAIDLINSNLNAKFPTISELQEANIGGVPTEYEYIPDRYIRNIIIPYVCHKMFAVDEEGVITATLFYQEFQTGLFYMVRDYTSSIPTAYQQEDPIGSVEMDDDDKYSGGGLTVCGSEWNI